MRVFLAFVAVIATSAHAGVLYSTDFEDFQVGDDQWSANSDWATDNSTSGVNFIDDLAFNQALGKTAALGLNRPSRDRVRILTQVPHDHVGTGESIVEIETLLAVKDSDNNSRDDFLFSIYNNSGTRLASIRLDNEDPDASGSDFGFWREDGSNRFDTGIDFTHEEIYDLFMVIDLLKNTWSASINGIPLFQDETFTNAASGSDIALSIVGYEWDLTSGIPFIHGDNFLFVGDLRIVTKSPISVPDLVATVNETGETVLSWKGYGGRTYQIEYSDTMAEGSWQDDLINSTFTTDETSKRFEFLPSAETSRRFFRVRVR